MSHVATIPYRVSHTTSYDYSAPVSICHNEARLTPRSAPRQRVVRSQLLVEPGVATLNQDHDYFGNVVHYFSLQEAHRKLSVTARSEVEVLLLPRPDPLASPAWEEVRDRVKTSTEPEMLEALELTFDSPHVRADADLLDYVAPSFPLGRPILDGTLELTRKIHREFAYQPGSTSVATPLREVLRTRRGVCQDFAHLAIALLRALGLPARYVSGYVYNQPRADAAAATGGDASHAWLSVYVPGQGYVDFDPTNGVMVTDEHVTLGWGRDFSDASPLKGVILGGEAHAVNVSVEVARTSAGQR